MQCISVNYKYAAIAVRQKLTFMADVQPRFLHGLCGQDNAECVLLCTCNRTEVYFHGISAQTVQAALAAYGEIEPSELLPHLRFYTDDKAMRHLFRVACGLHSMLLGEDEILRQTKNAYRLACECGTVGYTLHQVFQAAIRCAKRIKTETPLSVTPVSVATIAANEAVRHGRRILVIGATGMIGISTMRNLLAHRGVEITATLRSHGSDLRLSDSRIAMRDYAERYALLKDADCVISATSSPHFTITLHDLREVRLPSHLHLIDLAVPPDIDPAVIQLPGVTRQDLDALAKLAAENQNVRTDSAEKASHIIAEELDALQKKLAFHAFLPDMDAVCSRLREHPEQTVYRLKSQLGAEELQKVLHILEAL